jgi:DNA-binding transcriptional LysR family regulator
VVCAAGHPLARRRLVDDAELARQLWVMAPAGAMTRERFDAFAAGFAEMPRSHPLVTRNLTLLMRLMLQREALSMLPLSFVRHLIEGRELAQVKTREALPMLPLGLLQPAVAMNDAATRLSGFLAQAVAHGPRHTGRR